jgi:tetratricopeptide (TPR) repeat protein
MIEDIITIRPQTRKNYYTSKLEFATPVVKPKEKAHHYFQWGLIWHGKGKPAEAYKYYEKAIIFHKNPLYLKQMGILHHEMGYFKDALKYLQSAFELEQEIQMQEEQEIIHKQQERQTKTAELAYTYTTSSTPVELSYNLKEE